MKILYIAALTLTVLIQIQQLKSMKIEKQAIYSNKNIQIYKLLSSINENSQFWLPTDVLRLVTVNMHTISGFLSSLKLDYCKDLSGPFSATRKLNSLYNPYSSMPAVLLKIYLNEIKVSLLDIQGWKIAPFNRPNIFDFWYGNDFDPLFKTLCQVVDKKTFVDLFNECSKNDPKGKRLHYFVCTDFGIGVMRLYLSIFLDYAKNCPAKSKEVLNILEAKNRNGKTALDLAQSKGKTEIAAIIENAIKELKQNIPKKVTLLDAVKISIFGS